MKLAVIGAGKLGTILAQAWLRAGIVATESVTATVHRASSIARVEAALGIKVTRDNPAAVEGADVVVLCVKPQTTESVLDEISGAVGPDALLVSTVASVTTAQIEARLPDAVPVVRAMPNTPCQVGAGMTVLSPGRSVDDEHLSVAQKLFDAVGRTRLLEEKHMNAVTALSASGAAFLYVVLESLAEGGVKVGLPREVATELIAQTALGTATMALESGEHPAVLKDAVTTPAGCTIDGLLALEAGGVRVALIQAVVEAARRAGELA